MNLPRLLNDAANNYQENKVLNIDQIKLSLQKHNLQVEYLETVDNVPSISPNTQTGKETNPVKKVSSST